MVFFSRPAYIGSKHKHWRCCAWLLVSSPCPTLYLSPSCPSYSFSLWSCLFGYLSQSVVSESVESCPIRETRVGEVILLFGLVSVFPFKSWVSLLLVRWSLGDSVLQISLFFSYFFFSLLFSLGNSCFPFLWRTVALSSPSFLFLFL